ncbi:hypothetical protein [Nocardioides panacisoli]|uniref:hypothetical protein n=1 Tax=Nocardioides panacisoli TaxID=627624 RepID=UPI0031E236DF
MFMVPLPSKVKTFRYLVRSCEGAGSSSNVTTSTAHGELVRRVRKSMIESSDPRSRRYGDSCLRSRGSTPSPSPSG